MRRNVALWLQAGFFVVFGLMSVSGFGQVVTGRLLGTVRDSSGAVVPNVDLTVTNQNTGVSVSVKSNQAGEYVAPYLEPGTYSVTAKLQGFQSKVSENNSVQVNETRRVDFVLAPGSLTETVEVSAQALTLQTESTSYQASLNATLVDSVPNLSHNPWYYVGLLPNVVMQSANGNQSLNDTQGTGSLGVGIDGHIATSGFSINGGKEYSNDLRLDGVSVAGTGWNDAVVNPNTEGISEVRVVSNNYTAEYGRGVGIVLITTKSGTNEFHGAAFDQIRNEALNANSFANNAQGVPRGPYKLNYFGGSVGGPIVKKKAFFFVSYEGFRFKKAQDGFLTVPTDAERKGDFSKTVINDNGVPTPIRLFDPFNATQISPNVFRRAEVPNADIRNLARGVDSFGLKIISYYPQPNSPPIDVYNTNNYRYDVVVPFSKNNVNSRVDYQSGLHRIYGTFGIQRASGTFPGFLGPDNPFQGPRNSANPDDRTPYATIGDTLSLSPTLVLDMRFGLLLTRTVNSRPTSKFDYNSVGMPPAIQALIPKDGATPDTEFQQRWSSLNEDAFFNKKEHVTHTEFVGSVTKVAGKWTVKTGADYRVDLSNFSDIAEGAARLDSPGWTGAAGSYSAQFVDALGFLVAQDSRPNIQGLNDANILMGAGAWTRLSGGFATNPALAAKNFALYVQTDWHATPKLTVNLGLRWDLQPGMTDRYNRMTAFDLNAKDPFGIGSGGLAFPGTGNYSRNLWDTHYKDFGPRLGLAYRVNDKLVVRGGYGITYVPTNTGLLDGCGILGCRPFYPNNVVLPYGPQPHGVPIGTFHDTNVSTVTPPAGPVVNDPTNYLVASPTCTNCNIFMSRGNLNGRVQQWNFAIEKSVGPSSIVSVAYTGTKGTQLPVARLPLAPFPGVYSDAILNCYRSGTGCSGANIDLAGQGYVQTGIDRSQDLVPNPFNPSGSIPFQGLLGLSTIPRSLRDSPYPLFAGAGVGRSDGYSNYNALTILFNHSFSHGLDVSAHYTWSKSTDFTSHEVAGEPYAQIYRDFRDLSVNHKLSLTDIPNRFVYVVFYELPFGKGGSSVLSYVVRGWKVGSVGTFQSGFPLLIDGASDGSLNGLAIRVPGESFEVPESLQRWYDGKTTVTLPSGRQITPAANSFLKYNIDTFKGQLIPNPTSPGSFTPDLYWKGTAAINYAAARDFGRNNVDMSIRREFRVTERVSTTLTADFTNFFNHTQFRGYNTSLGGVNTGSGVPGSATNSSSYGTHGFDTYEARQIMMGLRIRF